MISTHILDTSSGSPAKNVEVKLELFQGTDHSWHTLESQFTNEDGRIAFEQEIKEGVYRLVFEVDQYFEKSRTEHFFLRTPVVFKIKDTNRKYHVPLLLNPYGYSTYRGS